MKNSMSNYKRKKRPCRKYPTRSDFFIIDCLFCALVCPKTKGVKGQADFKNRGKSFVKNAFEICVIKIIFYYAYILLVYGLNFYGFFPKPILCRY